MAVQPLRWGLLGSARINRALIPPLRASKRNRLVAVASRSAVQAESFARQWNIPCAYDSYAALLVDPDIDVIYIPLPNNLHADWTIRSLQAGKHVLCEKPLALSIAEVDAIAKAAQRTGRVVAEAFMYRHHPQTLRIKEIIDSGILGQLVLIRGSFSYTHNRPGNYRLNAAMGGGSLWDVGCYPVSFARALIAAEPREVFGWQVQGPGGIDTTFVGQLRFPGEVYAQFDCSFQAPHRTNMEIVGREGILTVEHPFVPGRNERLFLTRGDHTETIRVRGPNLYLGEVEDLADAVLEGKPPRVSLADSRGNVAALVALFESAREGKPISL